MTIERHAVVIQPERDILEALNALSFKVMLAQDGIEGVRRALRHRPSVVLLPVSMPHLDGFNVAKLLALFRVNIPLVFFSSDAAELAQVRKWPSVLDGILPQEASARLPGLLAGLSVKPVEKPYQAHFSQHEWADLLSKTGRKRILMVEDSGVILKHWLKTLDPLQRFQLYSAREGMEGVVKSLLIQPDLILTDVHMPVMDGLTMSQVLFILGKPYPILFLSGHDDDRLINKARKLPGVLGYLFKDEMANDQTFIRQVENNLAIAGQVRSQAGEFYRHAAPETLTLSAEGDGFSLG
ncbi:MAG: response regulator [Deltaproteobacteria bacterium]|nr:response regulator [Deltaproteobacteria bacterium]